MKINYNIEKLNILADSLNSSIEGALGKKLLNYYIGSHFLKHRRNLLYEISILIYRKYLKEPLARIDYYFDIEFELEPEERSELYEKILSVRKFIYSILFSIHYIITHVDNKDVIDYTYIASRLSDLCESTENYDTGVEVLQKTIEYIYKYKEEKSKFGLDNYENAHTFTTFTCDNNKVVNLEKSVNSKFDDFVRKLNFKRRQQYRNIYGLDKLKENEEFEEDFENDTLEKEYEERVKKQNNYKLENKSIKLINESDNIVNCLLVEVTAKYYRQYIKLGFIKKHNNKF